ncbi:MAG: HAD family hydrolase [Acidimicrobiales bacterium]
MSGDVAGVLLDVDGTLVDTNYLHTLAWARALGDLGEWAPMHAIHRLVGMGGDQLVPELLGRTIDEATDAWRRRYDELVDEARPFPGATALIRRLRRLGVHVVLATSSPADLLDRSIDLLDVRDDLCGWTSSDDVDSSKPDPAVFEAGLRAGNLDRERAIAVGDSIWDVRSARAAGIGCIGLESGGFSRHELAEDGAIAVYRNAEELLQQVLTSPIGRFAHTGRA